jgi:hypothetical protein
VDSRTDIHALVAGVSVYPQGEALAGVYPTLRGCAGDARDVTRYLIDELHVPESNIRLLTSTGTSPGGGDGPVEPPHQRPDYDNLVQALADLAAAAQQGDQVLVYFSGHGGQVPTLVPEVKGADGLDECLVPYDANLGGRLLRDVEIARIVAEMAGRGLDVTLVLDCCHAGGALRSPDLAAVRGVSFIDRTPRPAGSAVASPEILAAAWQAAGGRCPPGVVLLAACRPGEKALEVLFQGRKRGIFTWALLDGLRRLGTAVAYRRLHERVLARVHSLFEIQTPMLEGNTERQVLGNRPRRPEPTVSVLAVESDSVLLAAGVPQGVAAGAWFALYPPGDGEVLRSEERIALAEVTEAGASNSRARLATVLRAGVAVEPGSPAVLLADGLRARRVALRDGTGSALLAAVAARLAQPEASGFLASAPAGAPADFLLTARGGDVEILDAAGEILVRLPAASDVEAVIAALEHLARFRNIQELDNPDPGADLNGAIVVSLERLPGPGLPGQPYPTLPPRVQAGDAVCLTIENRSVRELNIAILDLQADWSIRKAYPFGDYLPLRRSACERISFEVQWSFQQPRGRDLMKIFAVTGPLDVRWLELPALGEPPLTLPRSVFAPPLTAAFAAITGLPFRSRALAPERQPQHAWTVVDFELEVTAHPRPPAG